MAKLFANWEDPDQMPNWCLILVCTVCLPITLLGVPALYLNGLKPVQNKISRQETNISNDVEKTLPSTTSLQRRCNVVTLQRRCNDVVVLLGIYILRQVEVALSTPDDYPTNLAPIAPCLFRLL